MLFVFTLLTSFAPAAEPLDAVATDPISRFVALLSPVTGPGRAAVRFRTELARALHARALAERARPGGRGVFARTSALDRHVDVLVGQLTAALNALEDRPADPAERARRVTAALDVIARAYLAAANNLGEPRPIARRVDVASGVAIAGGGLAMLGSLATESTPLMAGGGALILAAVVTNAVAKATGLTTRRAADDAATRARVAERAIERFWRATAAHAPEAFLRELEPADFARELVSDLNRVGDGLVTECDAILVKVGTP